MKIKEKTGSTVRIASVVLMCALFAVSVSCPVVGRWSSLSVMQLGLLGFVAYLVWIALFAWVQWKQKEHLTRTRICAKILLAIMVTMVFLWFGDRLGTYFGTAIRSREIKAAIDAGLQMDCVQLMSHWPVKGDMIQEKDPSFAALPRSLRILAPVYVTCDRTEDANTPASVGLCKNGFGGFAAGVRVFRSEQDAEHFISDMERTMNLGKDFGFEKIAPAVYYWWQGT